MKEQIKMIIENYCQGIEWLEFNVTDLDKMADEILALQLLQTDVIYQLCECGGNERVALDCTSKNCRHPKYNKK